MYTDAQAKCLKANDHAACPPKEPSESIRVWHPCLRCSRTDNRLLILQVKEDFSTQKYITRKMFNAKKI